MLQSAEVCVPPRQLEAVEEQIAAVREFLQSCQTKGPQRQGVASECKDLEHSLNQVYMRLNLYVTLAIHRQMSEELPAGTERAEAPWPCSHRRGAAGFHDRRTPRGGGGGGGSGKSGQR